MFSGSISRQFIFFEEGVIGCFGGVFVNQTMVWKTYLGSVCIHKIEIDLIPDVI